MADASQIQACDRCHRRKTRCDKGRPECDPCTKARAACIYSQRVKEPMYSRSFVQRLERRVRQLEAANLALKAASPADMETTRAEGEEAHGLSTSAAVAQEVSFLSTSAAGDRLFLGPTSGIIFASLVKAGIIHDSEQAITPPTTALSAHRSPGMEDWCSDDNKLPPEHLSRSLVEAYLAHDHLAYPFLHAGAIRTAVDCMYNGTTLAQTHAFEAFMFHMILAIATSQASKLNWTAFPDAQTHHQMATKYLNTVLCEGGLRALQAMLLLCQFQLTNSTRDASANRHLSHRHFLAGLWHIVGISARMCLELGLHREAMYQVARTNSTPGGPSCISPDAEDHAIRRLCFWCVFALDRVVSITLGRPLAICREDIDVEMPTIDGNGSVSPAAPTLGDQHPSPTTAPSYSTALFIHITRYRDICGRCLTMLHRGSRSVVQSESDRLRIHDELAAELQSWRADTNNLHLFEVDLSTPLTESRSSFRCKAWYELLYHNGILLLYRPSYSTTSQSGDEANRHIFSSAKESITLYSYLFSSRKINFSWMVLHAVFVAGISYIHALTRHFRAKRQQNSGGLNLRFQLAREPTLVEIVNDCRACSNVLVAVSERCNAQKNCHEVFDRLSDALVKDAVDALSDSRRHSSGSIDISAAPAAAVAPFASDADGQMQGVSVEPVTTTGSADTALRECLPELHRMYDAQWCDDAILQLSTDWFNEIVADNGTLAYEWNPE
ncbi:Positive regulator of purine utilization [Tolypocladium ophioglossoides CBS 100239]|uniref:Positive regulator of purine utilization n=1 Tax=Tolypocladium ophioglossoides (strain CBS 100239) TaxID=1163406 RepID=A0A0L0MZ97_TOLOC|nr:Positive regulator of purine utilization [Tolypocladium ophioglossoides CBS 100239]